jgi:hypothetical protein
MSQSHKCRWVFGPMLPGNIHAAAEYTIGCEYPIIVNGFALAHCTMNAHQLAAARQDPRLTVLPSLHSTAPVPANVVQHHADHGMVAGMSMHDALMKMARYHSNFEPED